MRAANCKTVYEEIEEADSLQELSAPAMEHVRSCARCRPFYDERMKLRQLMASLEPVAAPPDFDFRVRSRLASEKAGSHAGFMIGGFSFSLPSVALATLVLLVGVGFALRIWKTSTNSATAAHTEAPAAIRSNGLPDEQKSPAGKQETLADNRDLVTPVEARTPRRPSTSSVSSAGNNRRVATQEFSSTQAPVIKQDQTIASLETSPVFPIEASSQPLKVSLDYATGVSRTISVPSLSFGSERAITGSGSSLIKTSTKGDW